MDQNEGKKRFLRRVTNRQRRPRKEHEEVNLIRAGLSGDAQEPVYWDFLLAWNKLNERYDRLDEDLFEFQEYLFALLGLPQSFDGASQGDALTDDELRALNGVRTDSIKVQAGSARDLL